MLVSSSSSSTPFLWLLHLAIIFAILLFRSTTTTPSVSAVDLNKKAPCYQNNHHRRRRTLPEKVIIGYGDKCNVDDFDSGVPLAAAQGVNVVIWDFWGPPPPPSNNSNDDGTVLSSLDFDCIEQLIDDLDSKGYDDTVHLLSIGGWNGGHLNEQFKTAEDWWTAWKSHAGNIFHGLDIDFEGNDNMTSPLNYFDMRSQLVKMGDIMKLAQSDGYIVSIVPAQSYLDIDSTKFSRYLNTSVPDRPYHPEFTYFGQNAYAYWLAVYGDYIDLIIVQFYESYSRATMEIKGPNGTTPEDYLQNYVWTLNNLGQTFYVDFESDPEVGLKSQSVSLPVSKLVWGFSHVSNPDNDKNTYYPPESINAAYQSLWDWMLDPRGLMFWHINSEGMNGLYYAKEFNQILHTRPAAATTTTTTASVAATST